MHRQAVDKLLTMEVSQSDFFFCTLCSLYHIQVVKVLVTHKALA